LIAKVLSAKKDKVISPEIQKMSSLQNTIEKIKNLETEKKNLLLEIEELKKIADAKAAALEDEVGTLRDEIKSLRILLKGPEPNGEPNWDQKLKK